MRVRLVIFLCIVFLAAGCSWKNASAPSPVSGDSILPALAPSDSNAHPIGHYIKHLIIVIQENRTLDNIFAGFPGADAPMYGYLSNGKKIALHSKNFDGPDVPHAFVVALTDWDNGKMDGFDQGIIKFRHIPSMKPTYPFAYLDRTDSAPYWKMAKTYVLADHMFEDEFGPSFTSHFDLNYRNESPQTQRCVG